MSSTLEVTGTLSSTGPSRLPATALTLLRAARRGLADAASERDPANRYVDAHLAALRAAAAILAARGEPGKGARRRRTRSVWDMCGEAGRGRGGAASEDVGVRGGQPAARREYVRGCRGAGTRPGRRVHAAALGICRKSNPVGSGPADQDLSIRLGEIGLGEIGLSEIWNCAIGPRPPARRPPGHAGWAGGAGLRRTRSSCCGRRRRGRPS
jgi:hypothetical protein